MPRRIRSRALAAVATTALLALTACGGGDDGGDPLSGGGDETSSSDTITVGSADFPESTLLAEIYAGALEAKGVTVEKKLNIGARELYIPALEDGSIDLIPEYTGVLLSYFSEGNAPEVTDPQDVYDELVKVVPDGLTVLEMSEAEDKDTLCVTAEFAEQNDVKSIEDLAPLAKDLVIGAGPEFETRQTGLVGLKEIYGLTFKEFRGLDAGGPLTLAALTSGEIQVGNIFSTSSSIDTENLVVLEDPKHVFQAENVLPLINTDKASATVKDALNAVSAKLTTDNLKDLLKQVEVDKADPATVAKQFLDDNGLS